jgi:hypothetical protein
MRDHEINNLNNFICGWYYDDTSLCDKIIKFHNDANDKFFGVVDHIYVKPNVKDSIDCKLDSDQVLTKEYIDYLQLSVEKYIEKYPYSNKADPWTIVESINVQQYIPPNGGFHGWHSERGSCNPPSSNRHLVFMTYLNDVNEGGETEFFHQQLKVKPVKGLTLIWPADWTFTHRGLTSNEEKYIITGWFNFIPRK